MQPDLPEKLNVLMIFPGGENTMARIRAVAPDRLNVVSVWNELIPEMAPDWPERMMRRNTGPARPPQFPPEELEEHIRQAHVALMAVPFPYHLVHRAPDLMWAHFTFAGITNIKPSDWWGVPIMVTSSRGHTGARPIAETAVAGAMMLARRLDLAARNSTPEFDPNLMPDMMIIEGKTMGIVGLGGIGAQVAKMSKGLGMRVVATRHSATRRQKDVDGVDELFPVSETKEMLAECDFVAVCAIWTPETEKMFDRDIFAAMKPGAYLLNVARGELIDDDAMIESLQSGHLGGAYLDVWPDDFSQPPRRELLEMDNVVITPHISGRGEVSHNFGFELFLENLGHLLRGEELINLVDWERGY